ncbi:MAG: hypothetical protein ACJA08_003342 [Cyclobacteriaceae bacterium]|jgi:hypothetical protein
MGLIKWIITIAILVVSFTQGGAQSNDKLFAQKYTNYQSIWPKTKLHLIFNQPKYAPGDTAFFKSYFLNENLKGIYGRQVIDLNLVNSQGVIVLHFKFNIENGFDANQLVLPDSIAAGVYLVTAQHSWMRNFDPSPTFAMELEVVTKNKLASVKKPELNLGVEGGHLISGLLNKVSIYTWPVEGAVSILDDLGEEVGRTITDINGFGAIEIKPDINRSYVARIANDMVTKSLPSIEQNGYLIRLIPTIEAPTKIIINASNAAEFRSEELMLIITSRGQVRASEAIKMGSLGKLEIEFADILLSGLIQVSLLSQSGQLLSFREFYNEDKEPVDIDIKTNKSNYVPLDQVAIEITLKDEYGNPVIGEFSISVRNDSLFDSKKENDLFDALHIFNCRSQFYYLDKSNIRWRESLDDYIILTSQEIPWHKILAPSIVKPQFSFNRMGQKNGFAYFAASHEPISVGSSIMFYLQKSKWRFQTKTFENGSVGVTIPEIYGEEEIFWIAENKYGEKLPEIVIEWTDVKSVPHLSASPTIQMDKVDTYAAFAANRELINQSYGFFTRQDLVKPEEPKLSTADLEWEIRGVDVTVDVQDYVTFPTMELLIKEVIKTLYVGTRKHEKVIRVRYLTQGAKENPLYIIDGIATANTDFFLSLKPENILKVKLVTTPLKLLHFGMLGKNGLVMVETKSGTTREPIKDESTLIEGLSEPISFHQINYEQNRDQRLPDFRSTIYWNPFVETERSGIANLVFSCSDDIGSMTIRIDGITQEGDAFTKDMKMNVKYEKPNRP